MLDSNHNSDHTFSVKNVKLDHMFIIPKQPTVSESKVREVAILKHAKSHEGQWMIMSSLIITPPTPTFPILLLFSFWKVKVLGFLDYFT